MLAATLTAVAASLSYTPHVHPANPRPGYTFSSAPCPPRPRTHARGMSVVEEAGLLKARATDFSIAAIMGAAAKMTPAARDGKYAMLCVDGVLPVFLGPYS